MQGAAFFVVLTSYGSSTLQQIPWSSGQVLELTLSAAEAARLSVGLLPFLRDIDTLDDLIHISGHRANCTI